MAEIVMVTEPNIESTAVHEMREKMRELIKEYEIRNMTELKQN